MCHADSLKLLLQKALLLLPITVRSQSGAAEISVCHGRDMDLAMFAQVFGLFLGAGSLLHCGRER